MTSAILVTELGGPEVLVPATIELPAAGPGDAVVDIAAAGVNFRDVYERAGVYPKPVPHVPGAEGAGTVREVGEGVQGLRAGDRVAWESISGSYAQAAVGRADRLVPVPDAVSDEQAAAVMLQGLTAHYLAHDSYPIRDGDVVLVHAGAGGVGLLLTQIATIRGARVITTVSTEEKAELSRAAGADHVLVGYDDFDSRVRDLTDGIGVAAVYDGVGRDTFDASLASIRRRGTMVLFGGSSGQVPPFDLQRLNRAGSLSVTRPTLPDFVATRGELLSRTADLFGWIAQGRLSVRVGASYPLAEANRAHEDLEARRTTGKVLLIP